tara:strand:+ start:344 stop:1042 length:699 start_codon:yes stop_codon:yes gene_type:complete
VWKKIQFKSWEIVFKTDEVISTPYHHCHHDFYGFVLYDDGIPLMVDSGGASYDSKFDKYNKAQLPNYHNSILINGLSYRPYSTRFYPNDYWTPIFVNETINEGDSIKIKLSSTGFNRIISDINLTRTIELSECMICIDDTCGTSSDITISNFFHFDQNLSVKDKKSHLNIVSKTNEYVLEYPNDNYKNSINEDKLYQFYSEEYGSYEKKQYINNINFINMQKKITHRLIKKK